MNSKEYENWFGIPFYEFDFNEKIKENYKNYKQNKQNNLLEKLKHTNSQNKTIKEKKAKAIYKNFLNKKRYHLKYKEEYITKIKKLINIKGRNLYKNYTFEKKDLLEKRIEIKEEEELDNSINKESNEDADSEKNNLSLDNSNDSDDPFNPKVRFACDDRKNGVVKFNGIKKNCDCIQDFGKLKHYIYLRTQNDFNSNEKGRIFSWKIKILNNSNFMGVGLADKYIVINNKCKFFSKREGFYNGVFCLYNIYNEDIKTSHVYPWHPGNIDLNEKAIDFPSFKKGLEIILLYNTDEQKLEFISNEKVRYVYKMENVISLGSIGRNTFTPCIIFFYPNDQIQISKLYCNKKMDPNN